MKFDLLKKTRSYLFIIGTFFLLTPHQVFAETSSEKENGFSIQAKAALAVDLETGTILYEQNSEEVLPIASITKLLSFYVIQQAIADGELNWTDEIIVSQDVAELSQDLTLSNVILDEGDAYTVKALFEAAVLQSANGAMVALAEAVAETEFAFVDLMKKQLEIWGINNPKLINSTGLNNEDIKTPLYPDSGPTDENELTAREVAIVARHLIQDFPEILDFTKIAATTFESKSSGPALMYSTNWLLPGMPYEKEGVDGLKTGTTILAGPSFVGSTVREERRIITVILNAQNDEENPDARFTETSRLMDYAYEEWSIKEILKKGDTLSPISPIPVLDGKELEVPIIVQEPLNLLLPTKTTKKDFNYQLSLKDQQSIVAAPIQKEQELGTFTMDKKDKIDYLEVTDQEEAQKKLENLPFYAQAEVKKANFFVRLWRKLF